MAEFSIFKNSFSEEPDENIKEEEFVERIKSGHWSKPVLKLRVITDLRNYKRAKENLPGAAISAKFKTRDKFLPMGERIIKPSGLIALDVDKKDNPSMRVQDLIDKQCLMEYISAGGEGKKIVYRCKATKDPAEHRRIHDAAVLRLEKLGVKLKIDPVVKSLMSFQFVSYDPQIFYNEKSKVMIQPLPAIKIKKQKPSENQQEDIRQLNEYIDSLGDIDITKDYVDWLNIGMGLSYSLGESGRDLYHRISKNYKAYSEIETNEKYDGLIERDPGTIERPVTLATVYQLINEKLPRVTLKHLAKKYNKGHAVGVGEDVEQGDLAGMVRYRLFLFKKVYDKETSTLLDLIPAEINLNAFEALLKEKGFFRYEKMFVHIQDNIVEKVDADDILRLVTGYVEADGDYTFTYRKMEFTFSWEELAHLWRKIRAVSGTYNQLRSSLSHWNPNLLKDSPRESFIPYQNGVVRVTSKGFTLIPYAEIHQQIWKELILPREFEYTTKTGMFEIFYRNVAGRGAKNRERSKEYQRALWYYGYMLQGTKDPATSRAWILYDINLGNNGRSGKSIIGESLGYIRHVTTIDGKQIDFRNRFWLQSVEPWTNIIFIDDPYSSMSLVPIFNMITGNVNADKKGVEPITINPKFLIASNWIMEAEGTSESDRQFITQLDDFYVQYGKKHGNTIMPLVKYHGKRFFVEWDGKEWAEFDSFCIRALQHYFKCDPPENVIIGNSKELRFSQLYSEELFYELKQIMKQHYDKKDHAVPISLLTVAVKDADSSYSLIKAGRIVRNFMDSIGAGKLTVISRNAGGGRLVSVFQTEHGWEKLKL